MIKVQQILAKTLLILKKQFRYVFRGKGIYYFDYRNNKIHHYLANKGLMSNSYSLEFYGEVYKDEAVGNITPKAQNFRKNAFTFCPKIQIRKHLYTNVYLLAKEEQDISICCIIDQTTYNVEKNEVLLAIPLYVTLTNIGSELYDLLKDDLDNKLPFSYLKHILKNLRHKYKKYQFVLMKAH